MNLRTAARIMAVSRGFRYSDAKDAAAAIPEGHRQKIDVTVRVRGELSRGLGLDVPARFSVGSKAILAKLIRRLGVDQGQAMRALKRAAEEAAELKKTPVRAESDERMLGEHIDSLERGVAERLPKDRRAGSIRMNGEVEFV